jgi:hypothetical protein
LAEFEEEWKLCRFLLITVLLKQIIMWYYIK